MKLICNIPKLKHLNTPNYRNIVEITFQCVKSFRLMISIKIKLKIISQNHIS